MAVLSHPRIDDALVAAIKMRSPKIRAVSKLLPTRDRSRPSAALPAVLAIALAATAAVTAWRWAGRGAIDRFLWAEDGNVFASAAQAFGFGSVLQPYQGYLLLWQRLVAWLAANLDFGWLPALYLAGWFLAFAAAAVVVIGRLVQAGAGWPMAAIAIVLAGAQPHSGEVFFNLTNSQWWLGLGLLVAVILPDPQPSRARSLPSLGFLALAGLTAPISVLALPFVFAAWALNASQQRAVTIAADQKQAMPAAVSVVIVLTAVAQTGHILFTPRIIEGATDLTPWHWLKPLWTFITFGGLNATSIACGLIFWLASLLAVIIAIRSRRAERRRTGQQAALLLLAALVCLAAGMWSSRDHPHFLNPLQFGARYFVLPYGLAIVATCLVWHEVRWLSLLAILAFAWASIDTRQAVDRPGVQFRAYAAMARLMPIDTVPINPLWGHPPVWSVPVPPMPPGTTPGKAVLTWPGDGTATFETWSNEGDGVQRRRPLPSDGWETTDPTARFSLRLPTACARAHYVGVEIEQSRTAFGQMQLGWQRSSDGALAGQITRMMPAGSKTAAFAFRKAPGDIIIDVSAAPGGGTFRLNAIRLHCLDPAQVGSSTSVGR